MSIEHGGGGSLSVFSEGCRHLWLLMVDSWRGSWAFVLILGGDGRSLMVVAGVGTVRLSALAVVAFAVVGVV